MEASEETSSTGREKEKVVNSSSKERGNVSQLAMGSRRERMQARLSLRTRRERVREESQWESVGGLPFQDATSDSPAVRLEVNGVLS